LPSVVADLAHLRLVQPGTYEEVAGWHEAVSTIERSELDALTAPDVSRHTTGLRRLTVLLLGSIARLVEPHDFVEGLLCDGQLSVLFGDANVGKSFIALDLAFHVALGWPWHGRQVDRGLVVYIAGEGAGGMKRRIDAFRARYGIEETAHAAFALIPDTINFRDPSSINNLIATVREVAARLGVSARWIIVDTLSRAMAGGNENDSKDMGELVRGADQVRSATGAHVTLVHHTGKDDSKGARGHSLLRAAVDTEIQVWRGEGPDRAIGVTISKQRDLEMGLGFAFKLVKKVLGRDRRDKEVTSCVLEATTIRPALTEIEAHALGILKTLLIESDATAVELAAWQKAVLSDEEFSAGQKADTRSKAFRRARDKLISKGFIETSGTTVWTKNP
jgi:hypothetical protein